MNVKLLTHTPEPERVVACAAKLCYSNKVDIDSLWESLDPEATNKFLEKLIANSHYSPLEHITFTFAIEGVSRALMGQITRHRLASFSIRSQRYCNEGNCDFIVPNSIASNKETLDFFNDCVDDIKWQYNYLQKEYGISNEDARALLPNAIATRMIVTMNARELLHFFGERCCSHAQEEIRMLACRMLVICKEIAPIIFKNAGAKCHQLGYCPESLRSCGRKPTLDKLLNAYEKEKNANG